ncbi:hypothetical protein [Mesorhizobium sp.]|uniref:thermonuclease family protein n=1 Tax=Mesorhizobium sp. TaxID=1871066 RepID=UPI00258105C0|nr:hypothetical protein [Mesorhizobium sp.]
MVEHGQALDWPTYSNGAYAGQQAKAKASKIGLWVGTFQVPWDWRAQHSDDQQATPAPLFEIGNGNSGCNIKGNISADGERIYHVPGQKYYSVTRITEAKGEGGSAPRQKPLPPVGDNQSDSCTWRTAPLFSLIYITFRPSQPESLTKTCAPRAL